MPELYAKFGEGGVLNWGTDQLPLFKDLETWVFAEVECEIAVFPKDYFKRVWTSDIMTDKLRI